MTTSLPGTTVADAPVDEDIVGTVTSVTDGDDEIEIKDFTLKVKKFGFRIDRDVFVAHAALGLPAMQDLVRVSRGLGEALRGGEYSQIAEVFQELLDEASAARFTERIKARGADTIDVKRQLMPVIYWLMEKHGLRPTQLSSDSSAGSPSATGGTTSRGGSSTEASV